MAKRSGVENQFCVVPRKSIKLLGESVGIDYLSSEVAATLAEDASYRIRQTVQSASQFVKHSKRDHMTGGDINRALFWSHVEPIYGYGSKNSNIFTNISTKDGDLFFHEDKEINLRELAFSKGFSSLGDLGGCEINVEVSVLDKTSATKSDQGNTQSSTTKPSEFSSLNPVLKSYFNQITRNIIMADVKTVKVILDDIKTNSRIQVLLPFLVHFITTGMQSLSNDGLKLSRVFDLIKAMVDNKHLYLEPYVVELIRAVMYSLIEKPVSKITKSWHDDWMLRSKAAQTLSHIDRKCNNAGNFLHLQLLRTFKDIYHTSERPLHCQYGAVIGLAMLGADSIEQTIFPQLKEFSSNLTRLLDDDGKQEKVIEILNILEILKASTISVCRDKLKTMAIIHEKREQLHKSRGGQKTSSNVMENTHKSNVIESKHWNKHIPECYKQMYDIVGDSLVLLLGNLEDYENFAQSKPVLGMHARSSMLNLPKLQHVRKMIKIALDGREKKISSPTKFSLQKMKDRRLNELSMFSMSTDMDEQQSTNLRFNLHFNVLDHERNELRFESLLQNSVLRSKNSYDMNARTGRLSCLNKKRKSLKRTLALLSLPL